jgi:hypothetical protein
MELVETWPGLFLAAVGAAFLALVAGKTARALWIVTAALGRGLYWVVIGWWVRRVKWYLSHGPLEPRVKRRRTRIRRSIPPS